MLQRTDTRTAQHILSYAQTMRGGGVERALLRMAEGWLRAGRRVTLVVGSDEGPLAAEIPQGVDLVSLGDARYSALFALAGHVRRVVPDLIFCPGNHYSGVAALTRLRLGRESPAIVAKVSNALVRPEQSGLEAWAYRRWLRLHPHFVDHVVAMTPAMAAEAVAEMGLAPERVSIIANPPALPRPDAAPVALPARRYIVGLGRLEPQKRWDRLIDAMVRIGDREVHLLILGEGSLRGELEAQVAALGLSARVSMPGHAGDPLPALEGAAVAVLTSDYEGVPGVLCEALSVGTPVVSTESSVAVREIVAGPELGTVVARDDAGALIAALDHWLGPAAIRPAPIIAQGDPISDYLALFDRLVSLPHP
ncbi:glycosyltransferase [Sphingomonas gei]|uniref:Glycosyltransferase n=1 Tax=Sphingomonas gei TaxID=1395960 RepID=A0A4S1XDK4_9SPHN|nr:glycosyltransferase [Sphingomonas gei]TGX53550.1 glycosyltransferase [Sphingomonas gei]